MIKRHITSSLLEALSDTPVVFLTGARQTGKSTLVKAIAADYIRKAEGQNHERPYQAKPGTN